MRTYDTIEKIDVDAAYKKEKDYWLKKLSGDLEFTHLPYDFKRIPGKEKESRIETVDFQFSAELFTALMQVSTGVDPRLFMVLAAGLVLLVHKYTGKQDIIIGAPISKQEFEGEFINTVLALRHELKDAMIFKDLLLMVRQTIIKAAENQNYPMETLLRELNLEASPHHFPLFDIAVLLENIHDRKYIEHTDVNVIMSCLRSDKKLEGTVEYNAALYKQETIKRMINHFMVLLERVLSDLNESISNIEILSGQEKTQLLQDFNQTAADYPKDKTLQELFEEQAAGNPEKTAVILENKKLSYGELNTRANQLARILRKRGVQADSIVGLMMGRSFETITGMLGTLKAGGAYLPIDVDTPQNRLLSILSDSNASMLLTNCNIVKQYPFTALQGIDETPANPYVTSTRPQITDLDNFPIPDRSLVNYEKYHRYISISMFKRTITSQASRGCPYNCAYCHKIWPKNYIYRSAEKIVEEVQLYYDMGIRRFSFIDDVFNLNQKNSRRFFQLIIDKGLDIQIFFPNGLRGDILTKDYIDLMVEAGTVNLGLALETASPRLQKMIRKNLDLDKLRENAGYICKKYPHLILELYSMIGFPTETKEEAMMTLNFIKDLKWLDFPNLHIVKIYPGSDMERIAIQNGVSRKAISRSLNLAFHELPETLPFDKNFTMRCQAEFLDEYFLLKERLFNVLPYQMKVLTEDEINQKYDSYLPGDIKTFDHLLTYAGITREELGVEEFFDDSSLVVPDLDERLARHFPQVEPEPGALRVLLLDLSQFFSGETAMLYDVVEPPLGLMYLMTYIKKQYRSRINGKIAKSRIDFNSFQELKNLLETFKPDIIGVRVLTFHRNFFHQTCARIRQWGFNVPLITGGPYATSSYKAILRDPNIDLVVLGEGEITFGELIGRILENHNRLPDEKTLKEIPGLAFIPGEERKKRTPGRQILMLESLAGSLAREPGDNPEPVNLPDSSAYIIYTSGSTGIPKGVMIQHKNVVRLMVNSKFQFDFNSSDVWTMFHSEWFDFSVWEIYGALLYGGTVIIIPVMVARDPRTFLKLLKEKKVTVLNQTPPVFYHLIDEELKCRDSVLNLRYVIFGGDALIPAKLKAFRSRYPETKLINMYGITETTVHVTFKEITDKEIEENISNIGKPIPTLRTYIMGKGSKLLPIGVPGELCVAGDGVGKGYLNRPELSHERFPGNPYKAGEKIYRSGDLARMMDNGEMEYLGRIDHQVKIRGYRIETGEIENRLIKHEAVREAVVIAKKEEFDAYLCAYIVLAKKCDVHELREFLSNELPEFMIPRYVMQIEKIPLTSNGKVNRKRLPTPEFIRSDSHYAAPGNEVETQLVETWSGVLKLDRKKIGIDDNFFEIGGNSFNAVMLISAVQKAMNVAIPISTIFEIPTVRELSQYIIRTQKESVESIKKTELKEYYVLSSAQKRVYLQQILNRDKDRESLSYNNPIFRIMEGGFDINRFEQTFIKLIHRHESLRTSFEMINGVPVQRIHEHVEFEIEYHCTERLQDQKLPTDFIRPFDLSRAPLFRVGLVKLSEGKHLLAFDMHHIITDGASWVIFVKEFLAFYSERQLPRLNLQYKDYSEWQHALVTSGKIKNQEEFWLNQFKRKEDIPVLNLPIDFERQSVQTFAGKIKEFQLDKDIAASLKKIAIEEEVTLYMVLFAFFNIFLSQISGQEDIVVGIASAGRRNADLENIIGMFVNTLALRSFPSGDKTFPEFLKVVKEQMLKAMENQEYPFDDLVDKLSLNINRKAGRQPLFDVTFGLQNFYSPFQRTPEPESGSRLNVLPYKHKTTAAKFDLTLIGEEVGDTLIFIFEYNAQLFKESTIERFVSYFTEIGKTIIDNREVKLRDIHISYGLSDPEPAQPAIEFNF
ncbi:MAG: amino acid adenylation domain-containing protein [Candidatus Aminicenantes bacterium]|nr:amino acid adenylation domain-containing protein [Candidatus Aminicenantes bacterium]NIM79494.1 amino acid adenylation domain-containing protein [Candidatus Aminicenantes bacterium]NIN18780.1 amino acid adenylation domain-containing protein [Candidatus Aminicenantes bacterium]NIN42702.1 amino acid adenylation domain-containing protein [Candidatus Aminicenantes bacterium]NIN85436.1 amino acid adenylation domain-containing protein [Candidatus Aminicenantes bacterium]